MLPRMTRLILTTRERTLMSRLLWRRILSTACAEVPIDRSRRCHTFLLLSLFLLLALSVLLFFTVSLFILLSFTADVILCLRGARESATCLPLMRW